jgi:hypothetical protein
MVYKATKKNLTKGTVAGFGSPFQAFLLLYCYMKSLFNWADNKLVGVQPKSQIFFQVYEQN